MTTSASTTVKSAMRTLDIIEFVVSSRESVVAQDIADALAIPASSLSYLLSTLVERDYLSREGRQYVPGPGLARLASPTRAPSFFALAKILIRSLRFELNETCSLMVLDGWEVVAKITEPSEQALRYAIDVGQRNPLHSMASGKAILAALPEAALTQYFAETTRSQFTTSTLTEESEIRADIARIRQRGYAIARDEYQLGLVGLACSIGRPDLSAVAVAVPTARFDAELERRASKKLMHLAEQLGT
jgi:IclR family acetate operon transcriptional repressor